MYIKTMTSKLATKIRYAKQRDAQALAHVFSRSWHQAYRGIIPYKTLEETISKRNKNWWERALSQRAKPIVMVFDGTLIGYATSGPARIGKPPFCGDTCGEIYELYLIPDYQGLGFGTKLFAAVRKELKKKRLNSLVVWALDENIIACEFYESLGGRPKLRAIETFGESMLLRTGFYWP